MGLGDGAKETIARKEFLHPPQRDVDYLMTAPSYCYNLSSLEKQWEPMHWHAGQYYGACDVYHHAKMLDTRNREHGKTNQKRNIQVDNHELNLKKDIKIQLGLIHVLTHLSRGFEIGGVLSV
jgi:hypothetical protein